MGMQGVVGKDEAGTLLVSKPVLDQGHIEVFVPTIKLVAHNRMANIGQVDAYLVLPASMQPNAQQGELGCGEWRMENSAQ